MTASLPLDPAVRLAARQWAAHDPDPENVRVLERELAAAESGSAADAGQAAASLADRFAGPLRFGTAGLRASVGPGPARMNRVVVRRAAAGLGRWLTDGIGDDEGPAGVVVGHDARHGSAAFARDVAGVLLAAGAHVTVLPRPLPTPVLAFLVRHLNADAGVMVTASHNPPQDNGLKVYAGGRMTDEPGRGAQIVAPFDEQIAARIDHEAWPKDIPMSEDGWDVAGEDLIDAYREAALGVLDTVPGPSGGPDRGLRIVYTPLHGVGGAILPGLFAEAGFGDLHVVEAQAEPDPDFPTLTFPNPEEPGALDLALDEARRRQADLVVANDPDADRLALAVPSPDTPGGWRLLTGDEIGVLLGAHLMPRLQAMGRSTATSLVSSTRLGHLARAAGVEHHVTLTGFKWIARAPRLGYGYEEALGYCVAPNLVRDKDGLTAALLAAELVAGLAAGGRTVESELARLDAEHGAVATAQVSVRTSDPATRERALRRLREHPPTHLDGSPVTTRRDLAAPDSEGSGASDADALPPTQGLLYAAEDGTRLIVRPSGTEPKLKGYLEVQAEHSRAAHARLARLSTEVGALLDRGDDRHACRLATAAPGSDGPGPTDTVGRMIDTAELARMIDHTALKPETSAEDITRLTDEARRLGTASVCVNPRWVADAAAALAGSPVLVCTVVGFPLGATTTATKAYEAHRALADGAREIDMVIDVAAARAGDRERLEEDVRAVAEQVHAADAPGGAGLLKVILETCLLNDDQIVLACQAAVAAGADYVKTSTGFSSAGARVDHVALMRRTVGASIGVKASGGVRTREDALALIDAGATRIGASASVDILS